MVERNSERSEESTEESSPKVTPLQALEEYSATHSETVDELLEWPYRRFLKAYGYWQKRKFGEAVDRRKDLHVAALYANEAWDNEKNNRAAHIVAIEESYEDYKKAVTGDQSNDPDPEKERIENDPFVRAGRKSLAKSVPKEITMNNG